MNYKRSLKNISSLSKIKHTYIIDFVNFIIQYFYIHNCNLSNSLNTDKTYVIHLLM